MENNLILIVEGKEQRRLQDEMKEIKKWENKGRKAHACIILNLLVNMILHVSVTIPSKNVTSKKIST